MQVNGKKERCDKQNLKDFLLEKNYDITRIAVEYNGNVVARKDFPNITLKDNDTLEIVCFVGGG